MFDFEISPPAQNSIFHPKTQLPRQILRPFIDAAAAFAVFAVVTLALGSAPSSASPQVPANLGHAYPPPAAGSTISPSARSAVTPAAVMTAVPAGPRAGVGRDLGPGAAWAILGLGISLLAAMNLSFFRHLRQAYAAPQNRQNHD